MMHAEDRDYTSCYVFFCARLPFLQLPGCNDFFFTVLNIYRLRVHQFFLKFPVAVFFQNASRSNLPHVFGPRQDALGQ